jgi:hypothetical protein
MGVLTMDMLTEMRQKMLDNAGRYPNVLRIHPQTALDFGAADGDMVLGMRVSVESEAPRYQAYVGYDEAIGG